MSHPETCPDCGKPDPWGDPELFAARIKKLEAIAEAANALVRTPIERKLNENLSVLNKLNVALKAFEEI